MSDPWVNDDDAALLTDLYQLTMLQAYFDEGLAGEAVFDLFVRRLPADRNYLVACGLDDVLRYLQTVRFTGEAIDHLRTLGRFTPAFLEHLRAFRFTGDVWAVPEGTPVFADEPLLQVVAPLPQAQLAETFALNQVSYQTLVASKAARVVTAAAGRSVLEFGLRRLHGTDAGMKAARAAYVAGVGATSNVLAGRVYGIPVAGTMAHSYVEAHDSELDAFRAFASVYPDSILLVDTYDTIEGVRNVIRLRDELGGDFRISGVRLDSGDLAALAAETRRLLDEAGLDAVRIIASGSLDEKRLAGLVESGAPIDGFGVGTRMGVSSDRPYLDTAYKLSGYAGRARMKLATGKANLPGRKQVYRLPGRDVIALHDEAVEEGRPLMVKVMEGGRRRPAGERTLTQIREHAATEIEALPAPLRAIEPADPPYRVDLAPGLAAAMDRLRRDLEPVSR